MEFILFSAKKEFLKLSAVGRWVVEFFGPRPSPPWFRPDQFDCNSNRSS